MRLSRALDEYGKSRSSQGYAKGTLTNDRLYVRKLVKLIGDIECSNVTHTHIDAYFASIQHVVSVGSVSNHHFALKGFLRWCGVRGYLKTDLMAERRAPKYVPKPRNIIPVGKFPALLDAADASHARDRAVVALALYTLARASEILPLKVRDLDLENGDIPMFQRKTGGWDVMPISSELDTEMRRWLAAYSGLVGGPLDPNWFLVPARVRESGLRGADGLYRANREQALAPRKMIGSPHVLAKRCIEAIGEPVVDENGVPTMEGMHSLRRAGARAMFDELRATGYDGAARQVQTWLHHATMAMTERYLQITPDRDRRNIMFKGKPLYPSLQDPSLLRMERRHLPPTKWDQVERQAENKQLKKSRAEYEAWRKAREA